MESAGYENAPATKMIAVNCACCARPLLDARSVETGMGPICRRKHGFNEADGEANWPIVCSILLAGLGVDDLIAQATAGDANARLVLEDAIRVYAPKVKVDVLLTRSARELANGLVYQIACMGLGVAVASHVEALRALGFAKLASIMIKRTASVVIERTERGIEVSSPYSVEFLDASRAIPSRRWMKNTSGKGGVTVFSTADAGLVHRALVRAYAGQAAYGPKGLFVLT
jgi:hypothetical protein